MTDIQPEKNRRFMSSSFADGTAASGRASFRQFLCIFATIMLWLLPQRLVSQAPGNKTVQLRIELELPDAPLHGPPRKATVILRPLDGQANPQKIDVSDVATTEVTLPLGRYEITSTEPVEVGGQAYGWDVEVPVTEPVNELRLSQENAVRVSDTEAEAEPAVVTTAPPPGNGETENAPGPEVRAQIQTLLQRWTSSLRDHNLNEQMSCYASRLTAYFRQRDVTQDYVRRDKQRFLERYPQVRHLSLSDVRIFQVGDRPEVTALKTWSFGGNKEWIGQAITHLQLEKENGRWVIVSERERLVRQQIPFE